MKRTSMFVLTLKSVILIICSIMVGFFIGKAYGFWSSQPNIPKQYQGYYLTKIIGNHREYNHITHISNNQIHTYTTIAQLNNANTFDVSPIDNSIINKQLYFHVSNTKIHKNGVNFEGYIKKNTTPNMYKSSLKSIHTFPKMMFTKYDFQFVPQKHKKHSILKAVKTKNKNYKIIYYNWKITKSIANTIKINNENNDTGMSGLLD